MPTSSLSNRSLRHRLKLAVASFLGLLIPSACSTVTTPMCYVPPPPTDTPTRDLES
jgi:hypothetical protein